MNKVNFSYCFGCGVCAVSCPRDAIRIISNEDGFLSPSVGPSCVECGLCLKVCAFTHEECAEPNDSITPISLAAWSVESRTRNLCTSGGVAFEMGRYLLQKGYRVVACRYNPYQKYAEHYIADTEESLVESIGSKYIQSRTVDGFSHIEKGAKYLVTGTPCQIDSLRRFIKRKNMEDDVILIDFFCHGVPSMMMWKQYITELENKIGKFDNIIWRDKETGWHDSWVMKVEGKYTSWFSKGDLFYQMFLKDRCLGKACYEDCKYKYDKSAADIRIGDLWGSAFENDDLGVNGIVCFTQKGKDLLYEMEPLLHLEQSSLEVVGEAQMKSCATKPLSYNYVMKHLKKGTPLMKIHKIASCIELFENIPRKIRYYIKRIPSKLIEIIK